ncbi:MAG: hypothetical protein Q7J79_03285 [Gemmatimonadales bacterium]|nr:hypothetical protein [Gemmatimonadales bacterium]
MTDAQTHRRAGAQERRAPRSIRAATWVILAATAAGCAGLGGVRPRYGPVPGSVLVQLDQPADAVIRALATEVQTAGLRLLFVSPEEGYIETEWYDVGTRQSGPADARDLDRVVKLRFFADPVSGKTRLLAECVTRMVFDPSMPQRELERMAPDGHQGRILLDDVLRNARRRLTP